MNGKEIDPLIQSNVERRQMEILSKVVREESLELFSLINFLIRIGVKLSRLN